MTVLFHREGRMVTQRKGDPTKEDLIGTDEEDNTGTRDQGNRTIATGTLVMPITDNHVRFQYALIINAVCLKSAVN